MAEEICPKHGCKTVPITNDQGSAIIAEECPRCLDEQEAWCPFCKKVHAGGSTCMGHYP